MEVETPMPQSTGRARYYLCQAGSTMGGSTPCPQSPHLQTTAHDVGATYFQMCDAPGRDLRPNRSRSLPLDLEAPSSTRFIYEVVENSPAACSRRHILSPGPFRMTYQEAMERYGTDRPICASPWPSRMSPTYLRAPDIPCSGGDQAGGW